MSNPVTTGALFPPWTTTALRAALGLLGLGLVGAVVGPMIYVRSPLFTGQSGPVEQPLQFDHRHHVTDAGVDCRYCHLTAETGASAGYPPTEVCMGCHGQIWNQSPLLAPVRRSAFTGQALSWKRVNQLPDFVYFNHSIHANKGVGCVTCHGRGDRMPEVMQTATLTMGFCVDCHRDPAPQLRPIEQITNLGWVAEDPVKVGHQVARELDVYPRTSCTACHR